MSQLALGDSVELLRTLPNGYAQLALTSPPYNMNLRIRNGRYCSRQIVEEISTKYANFADNLPMPEYLAFNRQVITELLRVSDLTFYNVQFLTGNKPALFKLIGEFADSIKEFIVWDKRVAQPAIGGGVMNSQFEVLLVLSSSDAVSRRFKRAQWNRGTLSNLWSIARGRKVSDTHGAVFPEELAQRVIENFSQAGDMVLDPFLGTGTTALVAQRLNRQYHGIEIDAAYLEVARQRLAAVAQEHVSPFGVLA